MKAVISVIGKDTVGILAKVSAKCAEYNVNIDDVTQTVMQDIFTMIMMADTSKCSVDFNSFKSQMKDLGESMGMKIDVMHEDIFNSMHRI
ncbi:MAG: ACT domain-containing protein [Acutalibacteraceae bacterium]|nr:ACT domain-containing protein [Acutalibacteraceae bacterium]